MLNIFKKKPQGEKITLKLSGMHCTSCSFSVDGELEDTFGVLSAKTSYAKSETEVVYDPKLIQPPAITTIIETLGYKAVS